MTSYYDTLARLSGQAKLLLKQIETLRFDESMLDDTLRNRQLLTANRNSEQLANSIRRLMLLNSYTSKNMVFIQEIIPEGHNIMVYGDTTVITMPPLPLKEHKHNNCSFFIDPLLNCFEHYVKDNPTPLYDRCIVKFKHIFPEDTPLRQLHDYDNLEVKKVLDAVALFFLTDDNIKKCQVHHIGEIGEPMRTEIWITPLDDAKKTRPDSSNEG